MLEIEVRHPKIHQLLDVAGDLVRVADGFDFTEGPIWDRRDGALIFSDILGNSLYRWTEASGLMTLRRNSYMANGNAFDLEGRVVTCEHATSRITRTDFANGGDLEILATHFEGCELNSPNDVVVKSDGSIYFTDPISGRSAGYGVPREPALPFCGVYRLDPKTRDLILLVDDFEKPNGLCFSRDEKQLYVNDTRRSHIRVFDVDPDGTLYNGRVLAELRGHGAGVPDGMKVDAAGNIYSCGPGGIHLFDDRGTSLGVIHMPEHTANICFGDEDFCSLYITASTSIYRLRTKMAGWKTFK